MSTTTFKVKEIACPIGLEVQKVHQYPNYYEIYYGEDYNNLGACSVWHDDHSDVDEEPERKRSLLRSYGTSL